MSRSLTQFSTCNTCIYCSTVCSEYHLWWCRHTTEILFLFVRYNFEYCGCCHLEILLLYFRLLIHIKLLTYFGTPDIFSEHTLELLMFFRTFIWVRSGHQVTASKTSRSGHRPKVFIPSAACHVCLMLGSVCHIQWFCSVSGCCFTSSLNYDECLVHFLSWVHMALICTRRACVCVHVFCSFYQWIKCLHNLCCCHCMLFDTVYVDIFIWSYIVFIWS